MSKSNNRRAWRASLAATASLACLAVIAASAFAGLAEERAAPAPPAAPAMAEPAGPAARGPVAVPPGGASYQLRCWQYGRLLFDERGLDAPPPPGRRGFAMQAVDGTSSLQVLELGPSTCLIQRRDSAAARGPAR